MLTRSLLALLCGALAAVSAYPRQNEEHVCEDRDERAFVRNMYDSEAQWVAKSRPGIPIEFPVPGRRPKLPHHPHKRPDISHKTIYQALKDDERCERCALESSAAA